jgi:hypothetical protein
MNAYITAMVRRVMSSQISPWERWGVMDASIAGTSPGRLSVLEYEDGEGAYYRYATLDVFPDRVMLNVRPPGVRSFLHLITVATYVPENLEAIPGMVAEIMEIILQNSLGDY